MNVASRYRFQHSAAAMRPSTVLPTTPEALFAQLHGRNAPAEDVALLCAEGSMTQALAARFGQIQVRRTGEGWQCPGPDEARLLDRPCRGGAWYREIQLLAAGQVRLCARTVVPRDAWRLQGALKRLGDRPLMDLLFVGNRLRPGVVRARRRFGRDPQGRLTRVTLFTIHGEPLLLRETLAGAAAFGAGSSGRLPRPGPTRCSRT